MDPIRLGLAALLSGLLALERKAFLQAMLSRPLVTGALLGAILGHPLEGVAIGAALELFYLGAVNMGASLPDNELFTTVAAVSCACALAGRVADLTFPATLACAALATLPTAKLGKVTDRLSERLNGWIASLVEGEGDERRIRTGLRHNLYGLWMPFLVAAAACVAGAFAGKLVLPLLLTLGPAGLPRGLAMAWGAFLLVAAAAAARTARTGRAFVWSTLAAAATAGMHAAGLWGER
ncbi:MAG: PTS sugar transporter subunit IIC [Deltaproteobacteria bacterium]|nr:PTS sugar transporter subunit IIC [Deltaproteobacteria bacterium]